MSYEEYKSAVHNASNISLALTRDMTEEQMDLFEQYCNVYEEIVRYEQASR